MILWFYFVIDMFCYLTKVADVIGVLLCVKIVFLINNTMEVLMLLVVLNSFLTNVIGLVTKNSAILWA
jgi:hypothetical protein